MTAGLSLMKIASTALAKSFLLPFGLSAGMSVVDAAIQKKKKKKKKNGSGTTALIISNGEMKDVMKIVKQLEEWKLLIQGICETIENETKEQNGGFLSMLLGTLAASILGNT